MSKPKWTSISVLFVLLVALIPAASRVAKADDSRVFPETGHTVKGLFLNYWNTHGGLAQQGFPISEEMQEQSDTDGKTYTMQYFERAVFEMHPENQPPFNVLLSLLGVAFYNQNYGGNAPGQHANTTNPRRFTETGKTIGGAFRKYWEAHGGLAQQGFPISDEFSEVSKTDGKTYTVQYFQRAVFEFHPEFAGTQNEVLLSLLGVFFYNQKHGGTTQPTPTISTTPSATSTPAPQPVEPSGQALFLNASGAGQPVLVDQQGTIFKQKSFDLGSQGWTHFTSADNGALLFYKQSGGAETAMLKPDGSYAHLFSYGFRAGHTHVTSPGGNLIALFQSSTKVLDPGRIEANGQYKSLTTKNLGTPYADVIGGMNGHIFFYLNSPQIDDFVHEMTAVVDSAGNLTNMLPVTSRIRVGADRNWKAISYIDDNHIFFYNGITGQYDVREVKPEGTLTDSAPRAFSLGWTGFALIQKGGRFVGNHALLLTYRLDTGAAATWTFDPSYNLTPLKTYQGSTALAPGWTMLSSIR